MSTTRKLHTELGKVTPTKSLLITSMPCERQAAHIRNKALVALAEDDTQQIVRRFKQSQAGQAKSVFQGTAMLVMFYMLLKSIADIHEKNQNQQNTINYLVYTPTFFLFIACAVFAGLMIPPNFVNSLRYRQTKNECASWLRQHLDYETFNDLANIEKKDTAAFYETRIKQ